jgi:hypothetical protein
MKLLQILSSLPVLAVLSVTVIFATASSTAMADQQHRNRNSGSAFNKNSADRNSHNKGYNTSVASTFRSTSNTFSNSRFRKNSGYPSNWNRQNNRRSGAFNTNSNSNSYRNTSRNIFRNNSYGSYSGNRRSQPYRYDNNWSVSLNLGSGYNGSNSLWYDTGFYSPVSRFRDRNYSPRSTHPRVIYNNQPTVIVLNENSQDSGHVITRSSVRKNESSLLRDINGFCFERSYDSRGLETRVQLPDSACNY